MMGMYDGMHYLIASLPDREEFIAELIYDNEQWGEISKENGEVVLELYPRRDGEPWRFPPEDVERFIRMARKDLLEGRPSKKGKPAAVEG